MCKEKTVDSKNILKEFPPPPHCVHNECTLLFICKSSKVQNFALFSSGFLFLLLLGGQSFFAITVFLKLKYMLIQARSNRRHQESNLMVRLLKTHSFSMMLVVYELLCVLVSTYTAIDENPVFMKNNPFHVCVSGHILPLFSSTQDSNNTVLLLYLFFFYTFICFSESSPIEININKMPQLNCSFCYVRQAIEYRVGSESSIENKHVVFILQTTTRTPLCFISLWFYFFKEGLILTDKEYSYNYSNAPLFSKVG